MSRSFVYLAIFSVASLVLLIPPLSVPGQGIAFVFEELLSLGLALILFAISLKVIRRRVKKSVANKANSEKSFAYQREFRDIILGTLLAFSLVCLPAFLYHQTKGLPSFYKGLLEYKETVRRNQRPAPRRARLRELDAERLPPPPRLRPAPMHAPDQIPFWPFALRVLGVSLITLSSVYTVEVVHANKQQLIKERLVQQEWLKEQAVLQANVLKKQLNPHFMFNTLNVLSELIYEDIDKSHKFINELSKVYRYAIEHMEKPWSTLQEEIDFLNSYVYLLKIRFDDKLKFDTAVDSSLLQHRVPAMTLELLVENAIKHNSLSKESPLSVHILTTNGHLIVKNNLQARDEETDSTGVGLQNLNRRLELLGQDQAVYKVNKNYFEISVPLKRPLNIT